MNFDNTFSVNIPFWSDVKMKKKKYLKKVGVPMKKRVVGHRVISFLLCVLMLFGTVPLTFAAIDPIVPDNDTRFPVIERSSETVYIQKAIPDVSEQETIFFGTKLGDYEFKKTGANLRVAVPDGTGGYGYDNYKVTKLSVEFVNKDNIAQPGVNKEPVIIYVTENPDIWVKIEYTFEVKGTSQAEIIENPIIESPVKYTENMKVSDLTLSGGEANVPGTFSFAEPDKTLYVAENIPVSVTFTPADPTQAEAVTFTIPVTVEKGDIVVQEAPTFTYVYSNRTLRNLGTSGAEIQSGVVEPSTVKWDFVGKTGLSSDASDPLALQVLDAGTYTVTARATVSGSNFNTGFFPVKVVIKADETKAFPLQVNLAGNELHIKADTTYGLGYGGKGTVTYTVNDTVIAENADPKAEVVYAIPESGDYTVKAEYTPAENDNYIYKPATQTVKAVLPRTVTVNGGSGSGSYKPGDTVRVEFDQTSLKKYYEFKGWKITNAEGETVDVGVSDLTQTSISFTMPDEDVTVEATTSFSIQLFFKSIGDSIMAFLMKVVEWIMGLFNGLGSIT